MRKRFGGFGRKATSRDSTPDISEVQPFGRFGLGLLTEHPVGLLVVIAVIVLTLETLPPARLFFIGSLALGGIVGFFLWLRHR